MNRLAAHVLDTTPPERPLCDCHPPPARAPAARVLPHAAPAERKYAVQITDAILADLTHTRAARTPEIRRALRQARWARLRLKLLPYTAAAAQRYARAVAQAAQSIVNQPHR